ncbi:MAG: hypothetical protein IJY71_08375 [Clostridia bacterium]|nr:hypothetical protein [Clostridia bacterium]
MASKNAWTGRFLCWDDALLAEKQGVSVRMHKPQKKNIALACDSEWEGSHNGYGSIVRLGDVYRLYYRACPFSLPVEGELSERSVICVAESADGIHFTKPSLHIYSYNGSDANNIVYDNGGYVDNFSVFYDENPACPKEERFKALSELMDKEGRHLCCFYSEDGYHFRRGADIPVIGTFDSFNVVFWDKETEQYFVYYRSYHRRSGEEIADFMTTDLVRDVRDIRLATSKDFRSWEYRGRVCFAEGQGDAPLYTNQIGKYYREEGTFLGLPVRYTDRVGEKENFAHMALWDYREKVIARYGRGGTAITDTLVMTSEDGLCFNRRDESFFNQGAENRYNWWYGGGYSVYGLVETPAEEEGASPEISLYFGENYRTKNVDFRRYTLRLDGFFSFRADAAGGFVLTRPLTLGEGELYLNFATGGAGGVTVTLLDEEGKPLAGYQSYEMFGDATHRPVAFEKPLSALRGKRVALRFALRDADLYSFCFV